ncbi:MAG: LptF/LptG family permease [Chitinophagaceae bacterium]|nr:LptF/LptG family permease [Chitinophagaceae bacterium]MCW5905028.1 LptF/LptG family permease [Chitinophagaceae bacterium]
MKKLDVYILKNFFTTFFFSIFLFAVVAIVIDASEKADDFVQSKLSFNHIITDYYFGFIPHIIALLFPLFVFIAVIFFTSKMAGRSEIIAILASGVSYNRWLRPYFFGGIILASMLWTANQYIIPKANVIHSSFLTRYVDSNSSYEALVNSKKRNDLYFKIDSFSYAGIMGYDTLYKQGTAFFMNRFNGTKIVQNIRSEGIKWDSKKNKWILSTVFERDIDNLKEKVVRYDEKEMNFSFKPSDLQKDNYTKGKLTTSELVRYIKLEEMRGSEAINEFKVELYKRASGAFTVFLLTIIGAIIAGRKVRGGSGIHLAVGFMIAALYIITDRFSTIFSTKGNFHPLLAAWLPNIFFCLVAFYLYKKSPK